MTTSDDGINNYMGFDWSEVLKTGHVEIDNQHLRLFDLLRKIKEKLTSEDRSDSFDDVVSELVKYAGDHLNYEEAIFIRNEKYNVAKSHIAEHNNFRRKLKKLTLINTKYDDIFYIHEFVYDWLVRHIGVTDYEMIDAISEGHDGEWNDCTTSQTRKVTAELFKIATETDKMTERLGHKNIANNEHYTALLERMINLLILAEARVELFGCTQRSLSILKAIEHSVHYGASIVASRYLDAAINYCGRITKNSKEIPIWYSDVISHMNSTLTPVYELICRTCRPDSDIHIKYQNFQRLIGELTSIH